jgi:hypothetical protein
VQDTSFYLALNAWEQPLEFRLPADQWGGPWQIVLDTSTDRPVYGLKIHEPRGVLSLIGHHFVVLQQSFDSEGRPLFGRRTGDGLGRD